MAAGTNCYHCLRWFVFVLNFLFWLAGMGVLGVSLWLLFDADFAKVIGAKSGLADFYIGVYILIAVGVVMTCLGFLGCCGALKKSQILLTLFFILLLLIFIAELTCGILMYYYQENVKRYVEDSVLDAIRVHYNKNAAYTEAVDRMQSHFQCCGAKSYRNWLQTAHGSGSQNENEPGIESWSNTIGVVPRSCCTSQGLKAYPSDCGTGDSFTKEALDSYVNRERPEDSIIFPKGCNQALIDYFWYNSNVIIGLAIGIGCFQLLGMVLTMMLCCWINYDERESSKNAYD